MVRDRAADARQAAAVDAREAGGDLDQAAGAADEEEPGDDRLGLFDDEGFLLG